MKKFIQRNWQVAGILGFCIVAGLAISALATDFPLARLNNTQAETLLTASGTTTTNSVGSAFPIEGNHYHTIVGVNGGSTLQQFAVDRSLDGSNWIVVGTNALLASGSTEVTMTDKWTHVRARQIGTNAAMSVLYLGGN